MPTISIAQEFDQQKRGEQVVFGVPLTSFEVMKELIEQTQTVKGLRV